MTAAMLSTAADSILFFSYLLSFWLIIYVPPKHTYCFIIIVAFFVCFFKRILENLSIPYHFRLFLQKQFLAFCYMHQSPSQFNHARRKIRKHFLTVLLQIGYYAALCSFIQERRQCKYRFRQGHRYLHCYLYIHFRKLIFHPLPDKQARQ